MEIKPKAKMMFNLFLQVLASMKFKFWGSKTITEDHKVDLPCSVYAEVGEFENEYFKIFICSKKYSYIE